MKKLKIILSPAVFCFAASLTISAQNADTNSPASSAGIHSIAFVTVTNSTMPGAGANSPSWLTQPLSLMNALNVALQQNATILKAQSDLQASYGIVVQTRAVALPQLTANGQFKDTDRNAIENFPFSPATPSQNWN